MPASDQDQLQALGALIRTADAGDTAAVDRLFAVLYRELHEVAERQLRRGGSELSLGTTTLLHEAYLDMADRAGVEFPDRNRFLAYASRAMRGLIIDYARRRRAKKRGGEFQITSADGGEVPDATLARAAELERLDEGLDLLGRVDHELAQLVDLHVFGGFTLMEIAEMRHVTDRTVQRDWRKARLLLHRALGDEEAKPVAIA